MKSKLFLLILLLVLQFSIKSQNCVTIGTLSGELSTKESLKKYWKDVTKKNLSNRGKIVFEWEDSLQEKSKDSIFSYFKILSIEKYNGESYIKYGNNVTKHKIFVITLIDTISDDYFCIFITDKLILKRKKIKIGDIVLIKLIPYTEYCHTRTLGRGNYNFCLAIGNIYLKNYNWRSLSIAKSPFFEVE